jgi:lysophospholipase L1-like esterase
MNHLKFIAISTYVTSLCFGADCPPNSNLKETWQNVSEQSEYEQATITCIGDSLTWRAGAFYDGFFNAYTQEYSEPNKGWQSVSWWTGANHAPNTWQQGQINQEVAPHWSLDGMWIASNNASYTAQLSCYERSGNLQVVTQPNGGSVTVNGVTYNTITPTNDILQIPYNLLPGQNLSIQSSSIGQNVILGADNTIAGENTIHKVANGGWGVDEYNRRNWSFDQQLNLLNSDIYIIMLGQNDGVFSNPSWRSQMVSFCNRLITATPNAKILLVSSYNSGNTALRGLNQQMYSISQAYGYGYINLYEFGGTKQFYIDNGYLDVDLLHFSPSGGNYVGKFVLDQLENSIAPTYNIATPMVTEPCEGC